MDPRCSSTKLIPALNYWHLNLRLIESQVEVCSTLWHHITVFNRGKTQSMIWGRGSDLLTSWPPARWVLEHFKTCSVRTDCSSFRSFTWTWQSPEVVLSRIVRRGPADVFHWTELMSSHTCGPSAFLFFTSSLMFFLLDKYLKLYISDQLHKQNDVLGWFWTIPSL